jgi:hypothetical protein
VLRSRIRRLLTVLSVSLLAIASLGISPVSAANPDWDITIVPTPATVGAGRDAGFIVTVLNDGTSQINKLSVTTTALDTPNAAPVYISTLAYSTGASASCPIAVPQICQIGTLEGGTSVTFTVAYAVPSGARGDFELEVAIRAGTGDTDSDGPKGKSRGDAYKETEAATIGTGDFDGGFVVGGDAYQTNPNLGPRNIQSTALTGAPELVPVMIEDGIATLDDCDNVADDPACASLFGEWSRLNVNNGNDGNPFGTPFKVTLVVRGSSVPGNPDPEDVVFVHVLDDGSIVVIEDACTFAGANPVPTNPECLTARKAGSNWVLEVWLLRNGFGRGGF